MKHIPTNPPADIDDKFISYYPLKQGLKRPTDDLNRPACIEFISYYPLKQGLKRKATRTWYSERILFISYYPLKQGLKLSSGRICADGNMDLYPTIH